ncbi:MAG: kinase/pyrophosphorylase [Bacillaceae bacterium]|nr:kinase/pyrophosphorylase [Bacillaceae bacterium]
MAQEKTVYVVSDSVGETAEIVVKAAASQFNIEQMVIQKFPFIEDKETIDEVVQSAWESGALIAFTLVIPELKEYLVTKARDRGVTAIDIMGPIVDPMSAMLNQKPKNKPGLVRQLDDDYFRKVEAIEFAVKYDDGRDPRGLLRADIVLIGVSRTSKTPLSMYLANKRLKVANVPLVPEVEPPEELFMIPPEKCIGLSISPEQLNIIRRERLKSLGLPSQSNYANIDRIEEELDHARRIMDRIGCQVIDVSNKAVEETANIIFNLVQNHK